MFERFQTVRQAPMRDYTTLRLGGPADWLITPRSAEELGEILQEAREGGIPVTVIGCGSNLLVLDGGIRGAVIAGGIRDTKQILEQNFPVFYKYRVSNGSLGRCMITHYQVPVKIGKVTVRPGDIIMGDIDGVICIPREIAYEVLLRAEGIERNEVDIFSWVRQGDTISEIIDKGGYF